MVPSRRPLELIRNERSRKLALHRRTMCLRRKIQELTTLCGIDACLIIYEGGKSNEAVIWPPNPEEVKSMIKKYKNCRKKINVQSSSKLGNQVAHAKYLACDDHLNNFSLDQLRGLLKKLEVLELKIKLKEEIFLQEEPEMEIPTLVTPNDQFNDHLNNFSLDQLRGLLKKLEVLELKIKLKEEIFLLEEPEMEIPTLVTPNDQFNGASSSNNNDEQQYDASLLHQLYSDPSLAVVERMFGK